MQINLFLEQENQIMRLVLFPLISWFLWFFSLSMIYRTSLFFCLEGCIVVTVHQDTQYFIKQIRIVCKTTIWFWQQVLGWNISSSFWFRALVLFWFLLFQVCGLGRDVCRCSKLDLLKMVSVQILYAIKCLFICFFHTEMLLTNNSKIIVEQLRETWMWVANRYEPMWFWKR